MSILLGTELTSALKNLFDKRISTTIMATLSAEKFPHTAPFNSIIATDCKHLRLAISKDHQTYLNILEQNQVSIAVLDEGDIAVSITGVAHVIREHMEIDYNMVILEIEIQEIKKDNSPYFFVTQGIRCRHKNEPNLLYSRKLFQELQSI